MSSFYYWLTAATIWAAALAIILDAPIVAGSMALFSFAIAWRRSRPVA